MLHRSHAATSSLKTAKGFFFSTSRKHSAVTFTDSTRSVMVEGYGEVQESWNSSCWGIWDLTQTGKAFVHSEQRGPYAMQTRVPSGSVNRRLAPRGRWGDKQGSEEGGRVGVG